MIIEMFLKLWVGLRLLNKAYVAWWYLGWILEGNEIQLLKLLSIIKIIVWNLYEYLLLKYIKVFKIIIYVIFHSSYYLLKQFIIK